MSAPKLFISYSWSNSQHEQWVIELATSLRESGIDVILDKWDLKEGHDAYAFMEKMVSDPDIEKVAIICDKTYSEKADDAQYRIGRIYFAFLKEYGKAEMELRKLIENYPESEYVEKAKEMLERLK